jgi:hypothetical protein
MKLFIMNIVAGFQLFGRVLRNCLFQTSKRLAYMSQESSTRGVGGHRMEKKDDEKPKSTRNLDQDSAAK